jgi:hypothetical protein
MNKTEIPSGIAHVHDAFSCVPTVTHPTKNVLGQTYRAQEVQKLAQEKLVWAVVWYKHQRLDGLAAHRECVLLEAWG